MYIKMRFKNGLSKALTLSYDDGPMFDEKLINIMSKNGLKGTFNINSSKFFCESDKEREDAEHLKKVYIESGNEIACHGIWHLKLTELEYADMMREVLDDRIRLEKEFNCIVRGMAYAYGLYDSNVMDILDKCGICYSRTVKSTHRFDLPENWLELNPTCHHDDCELEALTDKFLNMNVKVGQEPQLFYVWGHAHEFARNNNWDVIEKFAEKTGNNNDVWYATNMEIYDCVMCFERLCFSADNTLVYNPNASDVWLTADEKVIKVDAGKTAALV